MSAGSEAALSTTIATVGFSAKSRTSGLTLARQPAPADAVEADPRSARDLEGVVPRYGRKPQKHLAQRAAWATEEVDYGGTGARHVALAVASAVDTVEGQARGSPAGPPLRGSREAGPNSA